MRWTGNNLHRTTYQKWGDTSWSTQLKLIERARWSPFPNAKLFQMQEETSWDHFLPFRRILPFDQWVTSPMVMYGIHFWAPSVIFYSDCSTEHHLKLQHTCFKTTNHVNRCMFVKPFWKRYNVHVYILKYSCRKIEAWEWNKAHVTPLTSIAGKKVPKNKGTCGKLLNHSFSLASMDWVAHQAMLIALLFWACKSGSKWPTL